MFAEGLRRRALSLSRALRLGNQSFLAPTAGSTRVPRAADGRQPLSPPSGWACLPPGDAAITKRVKQLGHRGRSSKRRAGSSSRKAFGRRSRTSPPRVRQSRASGPRLNTRSGERPMSLAASGTKRNMAPSSKPPSSPSASPSKAWRENNDNLLAQADRCPCHAGRQRHRRADAAYSDRTARRGRGDRVDAASDDGVRPARYSSASRGSAAKFQARLAEISRARARSPPS